MNMDRIIGMVVNQVVRRVVNIVVDRGFSFASRKAADLTTPDPEEAAPRGQIPTDPARDAQLRSMAEKAANTAKLTRRLRRF